MIVSAVLEYIRYILMEGKQALGFLLALLSSDSDAAGETFGYYFYNLLLCAAALCGAIIGGLLSQWTAKQ